MAPERARVTGRATDVPAAKPLVTHVVEPTGNAEPGALVIALHGFGADERDLVPLARQLLPDARVVGVRAPVARRGGGYAWFRIGADETQYTRVLRAAADRVVASVRPHLADVTGPVVMIGFSQGASAALAVALESRAELLLDAVVLFSGLELSGVGTEELDGLKVLVVHGENDRRVAPRHARRTADALERAGASVTLRMVPDLGHRIAPASVRDARAWISRHARESRRPDGRGARGSP